MIHNKQLERELKNTIINYKAQQLKTLILNLQKQTSIEPIYTYSKKGINCSECKIQYCRFEATGYGRNNEESQANAIKNLFDTLITQNYSIEQIKRSLKMNKQNKEQVICGLKCNGKAYDETLDLNPLEISGISQIMVEKVKTGGNCNCVYYEIHQHTKKQILNLQARIKLLNSENSVLKEMLLKGYGFGKTNKENQSIRSNSQFQ